MATYKVIQDVEAEDKLVGPLTLRQFIYAGIAALCLYLCFLGFTKHATFIIAVFLPVALVAGFFAFPWGREQPTEIWALAKIRFFFLPRKRIWDQSGLKELVTITAPKRVEQNYTDGLSQTEVKSRLLALADTIDSRGWAIKNVDVNMYGRPNPLAVNADSDRLIDVSTLPQEVPNVDIQASDDMLDEQNNPIAQQFDTMIQQSTQAHHQRVMQQMSDAVAPPQTANGVLPSPANPPADYWFLNQPSTPANASPMQYQVIAPGTPEDQVPVAAAAEPTAEEKALAAQLRAQNDNGPVPSYAHMRTILPLSAQRAALAQPAPAANQMQQQPPAPLNNPVSQTPNPPVTHQPDPAIIALASNNDLNVATIARQANQQEQPDEVVISLH